MKGRETEKLNQQPFEVASKGAAPDSSIVVPAVASSASHSFRRSQQPQRSLDLHIEELVLNGFAPADRYRIGEAIERELTRLLNEKGVPSGLDRGTEIDSVNAGTFEVSAGMTADAIGRHISQAVYGGLDRE